MFELKFNKYTIVTAIAFILITTHSYCDYLSKLSSSQKEPRISKIYQGLTDFEEITSNNLTYLNLSRNRIKDLQGLKKFSSIDTLILECMSIDNLKGIEHLKTIEHLSLASNEIDDITQLKDLVNLKYLDLRGNNISDLTPLSKLKQLKELYLEDNLIEDISPLRKLKNLRVLSLHHNKIKKIDAKMKNRKLEKFSAAFNDIENISGITGLPKLIDINLQNNNIADIEKLGKNSELLYVWLDNNNIGSVKPLLSCKKLREVWINNNPVKDLESLSVLDSLEWIWFGNKSVVLWDKEKPIRFEDKVFENYIRDLVDIHDRKVYPSDVENIEEIKLSRPPGLDGYDKRIVTLPLYKCNNLVGIKYFSKLRNITYLKNLLSYSEDEFYFNSVMKSNIRSINEIISLCNLEKIVFEQTKINFLPDLHNLKKLHSLWIIGGEIILIDGLKRNSSLKDIAVLGCKIRKLPILVNTVTIGLTLNNLSILDVSWLPNSECVVADDNKIHKVANIDNAVNLNILWLGNNNIVDTGFLEARNSISELKLSGNPLKNIDGLKYANNLQNLMLAYIDGINIEEILTMPFIKNHSFQIDISHSFKTYNEKLEFLKKLKEIREKQ